MNWLEKLRERVTHYRELKEALALLQARLERQETENKTLSARLRLAEEEKGTVSERLAVLEQDRTEAFRQLDTLRAMLGKTAAQLSEAPRTAQLEADRTELFARLDDLRERVAELSRRAEDDSRVAVLEQDRTEAFRQLDALRVTLDETAAQLSESSRTAQLEADRTELFARLDDLRERVAELSQRAEDDSRVAVLERDRTELFERIDQLQLLINEAANHSQYDNRISILEENRTDLFNRIDEIKYLLCKTGIINLRSRLDSRIIRLELLWYYRDEKKRESLSENEIDLLRDLENNYLYGRNEGRLFPEDEYYVLPNEDFLPPYRMGENDGIWYAEIDGKRIYLGENRKDAESYIRETLYYLEGNTPHRYLNPEEDGIDIPEDCILLDIGAAEGYFGIKHIDKCKKVYFFECDEKWLKYLRKTCEAFPNKTEIIQGYVGDKESDIKLDAFFMNREKPTFIKMDVEGAEGSILRGMPNLLNSNSPLTILLCTYHRVEDWERYFDILKDNFTIHASSGIYWDIQDPYPPFFRKGVMRAVKKHS